jgi:hypothetical protein
MPTDKYNYLQLMKINQWKARIFIDGNPITITIQDIFVENGEEFVAFVDQNDEQRTLKSDLIEAPNKPGRYPFIQYLLLKQVVNLLRKKSHY